MERMGTVELARRYAVMASRRLGKDINEQQAVDGVFEDNTENIATNLQHENVGHQIDMGRLYKQFYLVVGQTLANRHLGSLEIENK
jgi:hypothetical protein